VEALALALLLDEAVADDAADALLVLLAAAVPVAALVFLAPFFVAAVVVEAALPVSEAVVLPVAVALSVLAVLCASSALGTMTPASKAARTAEQTRRRRSNFIGYLLAYRSIHHGAPWPIPHPRCSPVQPERAAAE
jgi:hypothetical protein